MRHRDRLRPGGAMSTAATFPCWGEQVAEHPEHGALFSRLHECGEVLGRGPDVLYVRFAGAGRLLGVAPALGRLLPEAPGGD